MKKLIAMTGIAALLGACSTAEYGGSDYTDDTRYRTTGYESGAGDVSVGPGTITTNGPGMHNPTPTGVTGPGTTGTSNHWDSGLRP